MLGQTATWADGLAISVSRPTEYVADEENATPDPGAGADVEPGAGTPTAAADVDVRAGVAAGDTPHSGTDIGAEADAGGAVGAETQAGADAETLPDVERAPAPARTPGPAPDPTTRTVLVLDVVVANGTDTDVNPSIFVALTSGGEDAEEFFDPGSGLTGPPGTMLRPGGEVRFSMAFVVQDPGDLTVEVRPAYHYDVAVFVGAAD